MLVDTDLSMAGYSGDRVPAMQKRMIEAMQAIPGVESVGLADAVPLGDGAGDSNVFTDNTTDLRPSNAAADASMLQRLSRILPCRGHGLAVRQGLHLARR